MGEAVPFGGREYFLFLGLMLLARVSDFYSTWIATPNLVLEANPIARKLRWKWGIVVNLALCGGMSLWPLSAIIIATSSALVAARNFQSAWIMRAMGEENYRLWISERVDETPLSLLLLCLFGQALLTAAVSGALLCFGGGQNEIVLGVGLGILGYALAVVIYTLLALWRRRSGMSE